MKQNTRHAFIGFLILVIVAGCSVHKMQPKPLSIDVPPAFQSAAAQQDLLPLPFHWWDVFEDKNLDDLMAKTFTGNLDLAQSVARLQQAQALQRQRSADRWPFLNLEGSAARSRKLTATGASTGNTTSLSLVAGYEVDVWEKLKSLSQAQGLDTAASREDLHTLYLTLSAQVAEFYYLMVQQRSQLALIDQTITSRKDNLELVEQRYRQGMVSALDLYQARQNLANAHAQRPGVEGQLVTASHALAVLTGGYPTAGLGGNLALLPDLPQAFPMGLPSDLLKKRPDIQSAMYRLEASDQRIAAAVADRFPSINLLADYGSSRTDFDTVLSGTVWSLAGQLAMPLIDFQKRKAEVERNEAVFAERLAFYQQTVLTAFQEVEDALVENEKARESIVRYRTEVAAAQDTLRLSRANYMDGLSDYLPVLTAQTTHFNSQIRLLTAQRKRISARISLARAMGGNWMADVATVRLQSSSKER